MPLPTCGGAGNEVTLQKGPLIVDVIWDHDGVSTPPNCNGNIVTLRTVNGSSVTARVLLPNKRSNPQYIDLAPGSDTTLDARVQQDKNQMRQIGVETYQDVLGVDVIPLG